MERLILNLAAARRRTDGPIPGRVYWTAETTLIVGNRVLDGSQGPGYYPAEEIEADPLAWNGMPLVLWHPQDEDGEPLQTARDPKVLNKYGVGQVFGAVADGQLRAVSWFDEELTRNADRRFGSPKSPDYRPGYVPILPRLQQGLPIEVSTGLFPSYDRTPGVTNDGQRYDWIARSIRADHVAVLPLRDDAGACDVAMGCGVNNGSVLSRIGDQLATLARMCWGKPCPDGGGGDGGSEGGGGGSGESSGGGQAHHPVPSHPSGQEYTPAERDAWKKISSAKTPAEARKIAKGLETKAADHEIAEIRHKNDPGSPPPPAEEKMQAGVIDHLKEQHIASLKAKAVDAGGSIGGGGIEGRVKAARKYLSDNQASADLDTSADNAYSIPMKKTKDDKAKRKKIVMPRRPPMKASGNARMCWGEPCPEGGPSTGGDGGQKTKITDTRTGETSEVEEYKSPQQMAHEEIAKKLNAPSPPKRQVSPKKAKEADDKKVRSKLDSMSDDQVKSVAREHGIDPEKYPSRFNLQREIVSHPQARSKLLSNNEDQNMKTKKFDRSTALRVLAANCNCQEEKAALNALPDALLERLDRERQLTIVVNAVKKKGVAALNQEEMEGEASGVDIAGLAEFLGITADPASDPVGFVNELKGKLDEISSKLGIAAPPPAAEEELPVESMDFNEKDEDEEDADRMAASSRRKFNEADLPAEVRRDLAYARNQRQKVRRQNIDRLTANFKNKKAAVKAYEGLSDEQVQALANELAPERDDSSSSSQRSDNRGSWFGGGKSGEPEPIDSFPAANQAEDQDDIDDGEMAVINQMTPKRIDWSKQTKNGSRRQKASA